MKLDLEREFEQEFRRHQGDDEQMIALNSAVQTWSPPSPVSPHLHVTVLSWTLIMSVGVPRTLIAPNLVRSRDSLLCSSPCLRCFLDPITETTERDACCTVDLGVLVKTRQCRRHCSV